jgi:hypothetical protein
MATPKEIPSKVNHTTNKVTAASGNSLYIVGALKAGTLTIDISGANITCGSVGPVGIPSPIECRSFTPQTIGQIAYYGVTGAP